MIILRSIIIMTNKIGILDPEGVNPNPLNNESYSDTYKTLAKVWSTYPAYSKANEVLESLDKNQLTLIISGTGSGKTVLIPKFALHYTNYEGKIAMTFPKRIITRSAAEFAAKTLDVALGKSIGYVYKGSPKEMLGPDNRMVYMTDGTLIMKIVRDPLLTEYKVIIIDEAHERKVQIDMILLFLKRILESGKRPDLRVIIMSATIDGPKYLNYFSGVTSQIINISGQPMHEIVTHYLDTPTRSYLDEGFKIIEEIIHEKNKRDMLFFITTGTEAFQTCNKVREKYHKVYCIEVYADMDKEFKKYAETKDKFLELGNYDQKLVMATNVAESSITIDGLRYVIDSGYELYSYFDPDTMAQVLEKKLITKAQALQRRGRVGRTEPGICYHLLTKAQFEGLADYPAPDILKQDITIDFLKIIQTTDSRTYAEGYETLQQLMDPPHKNFIDIAHGLFKLYKLIDENGKMTKISGDILQFSSLPLNRSLFLVYSYQLMCAKEASIILAMIDELKGKPMNLFYKSDTICESGCKTDASKKFIKTIMHKKSDHLTFLAIFQKYKEISDRETWARKYGIRIDTLKKADKKANEYYRKIITASRAPPLSRAETVDVKKRVMEALRLSHRHLIAKDLETTYPKKKHDGKISRDSVVNQSYKPKELTKKTFIYDEFVNITGSWEFNLITLI